MTVRYSVKELRYIMKRLRDPLTGCPWDIKQTFTSITSSTIEEAYEVVDAIERGSRSDIKEELGDLLFQIIFYSQLGEEETSFNFEDVVDTLALKLIRRHPHVFPGGDLTSKQETKTSVDAVRAQWDQIKAIERTEKGKSEIFDDIPSAFPAITRAVKIQKRASAVGFDWSSAKDVFLKLDEELDELQSAIKQGNQDDVFEELGDLLFTVVNVARKLKVEPESALRFANNKFSKRFQRMNQIALKGGKQIESLSEIELNTLWDQVKQSAN